MLRHWGNAKANVRDSIVLVVPVRVTLYVNGALLLIKRKLLLKKGVCFRGLQNKAVFSGLLKFPNSFLYKIFALSFFLLSFGYNCKNEHV